MIVADIEASGLDFRKNSIVSIGAVDFEDPKRQFYAEPRIWDGAECNLESLAINGFTEEECKESKGTSRNMLCKTARSFNNCFCKCNATGKH